MALDEARLRERFAAALLDWRTQRGRGDPQRFPQLQAATEIGTGYRTYQSWEAGDHLPRRWSDVERVLELIGVPTTALFGEDEPAPAEEPSTNGQPTGETRWQRELRDTIERGFRDISARLDRIEAAQRSSAASRQLS